jgi:hypothetical protein
MATSGQDEKRAIFGSQHGYCIRRSQRGPLQGDILVGNVESTKDTTNWGDTLSAAFLASASESNASLARFTRRTGKSGETIGIGIAHGVSVRA